MITDLVQKVTFGKHTFSELPEFKTGDTISVHVKVKEGEKERTQIFKGVVIKVQGSAMGRSFTVRKMSSGVGVERTFPFASPAIGKIQVLSRGKVRRSKIFYLRGLRGRAARLESELVHAESQNKKKAKKEDKPEKVTEPVKEVAKKVEAKAEASAKEVAKKAEPAKKADTPKKEES